MTNRQTNIDTDADRQEAANEEVHPIQILSSELPRTMSSRIVSSLYYDTHARIIIRTSQVKQ